MGSYGASSVGPQEESATTDGVVIDESRYPRGIEEASPGQTLLIRGGSYSGGFTIPEGVTVKPYNGEEVRIRGVIDMESNTVLAGLYVTAPSGAQWAIRLKATDRPKSDILIRNNRILGGTVETIRVSQNVHRVVIASNYFPSGNGNHIIKFHTEESSWHPSGSIVGNIIGSPAKGDGIQIESGGVIAIEGNTFTGAPENNIDVKAGTISIRRNLFVDSTSAAVLVHQQGHAVIENNRFSSGRGIALGSKNYGNPSWELRNNLIEGGEIRLRRSFEPVIVADNTIIGGLIKVGMSGEDDYPRDARITGNYIESTSLSDRTTSKGGSWQCSGNTLVEVSGDWGSCT